MLINKKISNTTIIVAFMGVVVNIIDFILTKDIDNIVIAFLFVSILLSVHLHKKMNKQYCELLECYENEREKHYNE